MFLLADGDDGTEPAVAKLKTSLTRTVVCVAKSINLFLVPQTTTLTNAREKDVRARMLAHKTEGASKFFSEFSFRKVRLMKKQRWLRAGEAVLNILDQRRNLEPGLLEFKHTAIANKLSSASSEFLTKAVPPTLNRRHWLFLEVVRFTMRILEDLTKSVQRLMSISHVGSFKFPDAVRSSELARLWREIRSMATITKGSNLTKVADLVTCVWSVPHLGDEGRTVAYCALIHVMIKMHNANGAAQLRVWPFRAADLLLDWETNRATVMATAHAVLLSTEAEVGPWLHEWRTWYRATIVRISLGAPAVLKDFAFTEIRTVLSLLVPTSSQVERVNRWSSLLQENAPNIMQDLISARFAQFVRSVLKDFP